MDEVKVFIWLCVLTILVLIALSRKREVKYDGNYINEYVLSPYDMEMLLDDPKFIKALIGKLNEYQLNRSGEIND